ncbi:MAG: acyl phosphate:glycerol-3-phosphate acyltransferase [Alphaproteobacteria bacterium]|jgi:glycerol-3-phosphate acyltransferase PlsY|nr:acyl phosphate:glycerol-3-phosphate acyltransferase [Alphaproteobacteria bacterium]
MFGSPYPHILLALAFGYLLGSIPFGLVLTKLTGGPDLRAVGSGNIGATNVLRTGRKALAAATLLGDMLKGTVAVLVAQQFGLGAAIAGGLAAGLGAFLGHLFPVWLGFKGGKGVATYIGVLLALVWQAALAFGVIWIAVAAATRYSSLSALVASAATPAILWFMGYPAEAALFLILTALIWFMHRTNIARLLNGTEGKIGR